MEDPILKQKIADFDDAISTLQIMMDTHQHNNFDSSGVNYDDIQLKTITLRHSIYGTDAATATNYGVFFIAPFACTLLSVKEVHSTAGTNGSAVTLNIEKLTGIQAPNAGVIMLSTELSLKATANTVQNGALTLTVANKNLAIGDRLCMKDTGTLTAVADVCVTLVLTVI